MLVFSISDFTQNAEKVFNAAQNDEVIINSDDGKSCQILPVKNNNQKLKSPFDGIPCITLGMNTLKIFVRLQTNL